MYNRYIPQPDGTYRRSRVQEPRHEPPQRPVMPPVPHDKCQEPEPCLQPEHVPSQPPKQPPVHKPQQESSIGTFLRRLLPREVDTADLIVILLLLLMAGDCEEDRNHALLTLVIYLFM